VPFITYYLAVAVAGWLGGFGPAALSTLLSLVLTWYSYVMPATSASTPELHRLAALGLFVFVCLALAAITAALHAALDRTQQLAALTHRQRDLLAASENRFRSLAAHIPIMVWMTDAQRACTFFNPAWLRFRGRTLEQELGHGWEDGVHPDDLVRRRAVFDDAHGNRAAFAVKYRLRRADDEYQWLLDQATPHFNDDGSFAGYVGVATPIDPPLGGSSVGA
jgi:PAS domain S-box-containing protein